MEPLADLDENQRKLRVLLLGAVISVALFLAAAFTVVGLALWSATTARGDSVKLSRDNAARSQCDAKYAQAASDAFRAYLADIGDLIVIISTTTPGEDRTATALSKVQDLSIQVEEARRLAALRTDYLNANRPLPCPYPEGVT